MSAVKKSGGWWFPSTPEQKCITYEKFSTYVLSREAALMQMFQTLDVSGRGSITAEELEIALSHVRVKCPESKCVYKCRREVVKGFVATVSGGKQR